MKTLKADRIMNHFPTLIISLYLIIMLLLALKTGISFSGIFNESLVKWGMNAIFVISLIPMINCGIGLNFGMSIGISAGIIGMCIALQLNMSGLTGLMAAVFFSAVCSIAFGYGYARIINRLKGKEDIASVFIGYAFVPLMNIFWIIAPFTNRKMLYPVGGKGLRPKINLADNFGGVLDSFMMIGNGEFYIPLGLIAFVLVIALLVHFIADTKMGREMSAVRENIKFAYISGIDIDRTRTKAVIISTLIAAIGICVYSQSFGFVQLYDGTRMMVFPAISAILIGGGTGRKSSVINAVAGTYLYQMVFLLSVPVANTLLVPELAEIVRMIITNSIILFAFLWQRKGVVTQ